MLKEFWSFAERFIALDTSIAHGNAAIEPFCHELLDQLSPRWLVQRVDFRGRPHVNVLAELGPDAPGGLLLVTHSDTVPPGPAEAWTRGPALRLTRDGDQVVGLGVADVKLDYLCKAFALRQLDLTRLRKPVRLLATFAEEVGLNGAKHYVEQCLQGGAPKPEWVLCGEPSELIPCHAHKGYAVAKVTVAAPGASLPSGTARRITATGKAAHSSTPHLGENAILSLWTRNERVLTIEGGTSANTVPASASAIVLGGDGELASAPSDAVDVSAALAALRSAWSAWQTLAMGLAPARDPEFDPDRVVCNVGQVWTKGNRVSALFDARLLPEHDPTALIRQFAREARARLPAELVLEVTIERDNPGMRASKHSPLLLALSEVLRSRGLRGEPKAKATSTEAGVFARAGAEAAVFGPGVSIGNAHTANEWNRVVDLEQAILVYRALIEKLCL